MFAVSDEIRVRRFIILGTTGGTYYSTEKELTVDNIKALIDIIERGMIARLSFRVEPSRTSKRTRGYRDSKHGCRVSTNYVVMT